MEIPSTTQGSALRPRSSRTTMASADFSCRFPPPHDNGSSKHDMRPPRVMHTCLHAYTCRIYDRTFRVSMGLWRYMPPHPARSPRMRFLFVRSALCLRLPPHTTSRWRSCRSASTSPYRAYKGLSPSSKCALPGAHKKRGKEITPCPTNFSWIKN